MSSIDAHGRVARAWVRVARVSVVSVVSLAPLAIAVTQGGCMLITSPSDFSVVDGSTNHPGDAAASDAPSVCTELSGGSACDTCVASSCCAAYALCDLTPACLGLLKCGASDTACMDDNASGKTFADSLIACVEQSCNDACTKEGVGDPCGAAGKTCASTLTCNGLFCTRSCAGDNDCRGSGLNGDNSAGTQNRCVEDEGMADVCFPGCASSADCAALAGATCQSAENTTGADTDICASGPTDGGTDGTPSGDDGDDQSEASSGEAGDDGDDDDGGLDAAHEASFDADDDAFGDDAS